MPPVSRAPGVVKTRSGERSIRISFFLAMLSAAASSAVFIILGRAVDIAVAYTHGRGASSHAPFTWLTVGVAGAIVVAAASEWVRVYLSYGAAVREEAALRRVLMRRLFLLGPQSLSREEIGSMVSTCTDGVERIMAYRQTYLGTLWAGFAVPAMTLVIMAVLVDWKTACLLLVMFPMIPLLLLVFKMVMKRFNGGSRHARNKLAAAYLEAIVGLETLTLLGATDAMGRDLRQVGEANRQAIMKMLAGNQLILFVVDSGFNLCLITVATLSATAQAGWGALSIGQAISIIALTVLLLDPMDQLAGFFYVGMGGMANERKIARIFGQSAPMMSMGRKRAGRPGHGGHGHGGHGHGRAAGTLEAIDEGVPADAPNVAQGLRESRALGPLEQAPGVISVRDAVFSYDGAPILNGISFDVLPGEHIALCGPSGEGKSTLAHLLKGTLELDSGAISVNGMTAEGRQSGAKAGAIPSQQTRQLRTSSAYVAQTTWLFNATIRDNLLLARPAASDEELWEACAQAHIEADIRSMPQQFDTWVGDRGFGLSGGQMQRLSLARALVSKKDILILDEPTSQVDLISEEQILRAIADISRDKTVLMITHRRSSLRGFDRELVLHGGKLWEGGAL